MASEAAALAWALDGRVVGGGARGSGSSGKVLFPYGVVGSFAGTIAVFEESALCWGQAFGGIFWLVLKVTFAFGSGFDGTCLFATKLMTKAGGFGTGGSVIVVEPGVVLMGRSEGTTCGEGVVVIGRDGGPESL